MSFPPSFLDELRRRLSLAEIVGRRVRLVRKGREYSGLCPFHKEKTPSFYVAEEKGFFHCFGCGAHGDVIGFAMQAENLPFPEAVERLAGEAGLEVPKASPREREQAERELTLRDAMEAAASFYADRLFDKGGQAALAYLRNRGLDDATIRRFRLGYAPAGRDALKRALGPRFPEPMLTEAGLLRRPDDGRESYDYFRDRVTFPIGDRTGKVIAFGARAMGDAQPKYLNSPETPIFSKGRMLYGWAPARAAAARAPSAIVVEGYMDVIALHRAGFDTAVAPLGTALTEMQIEELWKLAPEPILCFDGDAAGMRAALRALDRALPLLKPGRSLRFAALPAGEDPDTLLLRQGIPAMKEVLDRARPLAETLWSLEWGGRAPETPERRAAFEARLDQRVRAIEDRTVQEHYRRWFRDRLFTAFRAARPPRDARGGRRDGGRRDGQGGGWRPGGWSPGGPPAAPPSDPARLHRRQQELLVALAIHHPDLVHEFAEDFATLDFRAPDLDKLRDAILKTVASSDDHLDGEKLRLHLCEAGFGRTVESLLSPQLYDNWGFARPDADIGRAREGWTDLIRWFRESPGLQAQVAEEERGLAENTTEENWSRMQALLIQKIQAGQREEENGAAGGLLP